MTRPDSRRGSLKWGQVVARLTINVILPLLIAVAAAIAAVKTGPVRVYWSLGSFIALAAAGVANYNKDRTATSVKDAMARRTTELATSLNDTGHPLVTALGKVTAAEQPEEAKRELAVLLDRGVSLARTEIGRCSNSMTRAVFYCLEGNELTRKEVHSWNGCPAPRRDFVKGRSEHDDAVLRFVHGENSLLVCDLENNPPPHFADARGRPYKSFVAVPVRAGSKSFGLLSVDSDRANALSGVERGFLVLIAGVLAAGMAHVETVSPKPPNQGVAP